MAVAVVVEAKVLRLCTYRANAITRILESQADLDAAVTALTTQEEGRIYPNKVREATFLRADP